MHAVRASGRAIAERFWGPVRAARVPSWQSRTKRESVRVVGDALTVADQFNHLSDRAPVRIDRIHRSDIP
jgi:hypothetical protein